MDGSGVSICHTQDTIGRLGWRLVWISQTAKRAGLIVNVSFKVRSISQAGHGGNADGDRKEGRPFLSPPLFFSMIFSLVGYTSCQSQIPAVEIAAENDPQTIDQICINVIRSKNPPLQPFVESGKRKRAAYGLSPGHIIFER